MKKISEQGNRTMRMFCLMFIMMATVSVNAAYDAQFVRCVIPETLTTDEIFPAVICMRNTGDTAWPIADILMHSQYPANNYTWGTYFILQHHGDSLAPGDTFNFTSNLRAPSTPGKWAFAWQCYHKTVGQLFGEIVPAESIYVQQRLETPPPPPQHVDSLLDSSDFEYIGSFKLPTVASYDHAYVASGLALRTMPDGSKRFFLNTGTYTQCLYEVEMPQLEKIEGTNHSTLNTAALIKQWATIAWDSAIGGENITANSGFWWDDSTNILYWTHCNSYYAGSPFPVLAATRLADDGTITNLKYWYMPQVPLWKAYWRGITHIPKTFADTYTGGRDLALGFGGIYSICQTASSGPAIAAIQKPDILQDTLDLVEVLRYIYPEAAVRNGNYFLANTTIWIYQPPSPWDGRFTSGSTCATGVFIDLPDKKGYVAFVRHTTGRIGYDWGGVGVDYHYEDDWYFYDLKELGDAALGNQALGSVQPSSFVKIDWPYPVSNTATYHSVSGACFDPQTRIMYVYCSFALDREPAVHAYHVKEDSSLGSEAVRTGGSGPEIAASPNPFNPAVVISVGASRNIEGNNVSVTPLHVAIYTISGRMITDLSKQMVNGRVSWDASHMPSGLYIVQAHIRGKVLTKSIILMK
ncbi:MAG: hypothetical protein A2268_09050 [Candidatus Raymondbacteria bacterium RifOxyA12_full_50_37]|uniref:Secretion system C-terminal sorting domain-containing protein n=1 Tax=Candidatus Raymondbacteria bacterium RIFOXYD12_FULL_49_13 TaxID=1817890 RepID=A0A1F7F0Q6_UNCRA|nr:MAG: hypothetical protein A2268_09050 [Candidatus Raymondbacteria bacterium RifOxyA12_full_50_37]OGJ86885.1 MAG: hypothetical protein A2248_08205 [Candidatus Raymondbacteria bacterium RIFOXYA2_FULL_49_16]OGJ94791.1 MAG: hypothetical protein A2350_20720 [Candidatus Raymondbacteria bacterium RifOxyB12_full_50_8]OGK00235.1 MAG: hypothetical protein A2519_07115 [Candidatus Raymondbacteria bacterium RIFOXYD12_FULL_49_13]OGP41104.1 MAG: hypothetical protein A2324_07370 [Candidatus Raymondbacteria 